MLFVFVLGVILIVWSTWGFVSSRVEQAEYSVIKKADGYEVRRYPARIVAETKIPGLGNQALIDGFRIVARYIFGANTKDVKIAMTAPVMATSERGFAPEKSFTATFVEGETIVAFGIPKDIVPESLPFPVDPRVTIVTRPETVYAALRFGGLRGDATIKAKEKILAEKLARDGVKIVGAPIYAGYNAPWTPFWMTRHEVLIPIEA
ncbi:MAG: heme-binding protein [Undibacterium sp.]